MKICLVLVPWNQACQIIFRGEKCSYFVISFTHLCFIFKLMFKHLLSDRYWETKVWTGEFFFSYFVTSFTHLRLIFKFMFKQLLSDRNWETKVWNHATIPREKIYKLCLAYYLSRSIRDSCNSPRRATGEFDDTSAQLRLAQSLAGHVHSIPQRSTPHLGLRSASPSLA